MTSGQKSFSLSLCCKAVESEKNSFADKKDVNGYVAKVIIDIFSSPNISLAVGKEKAPAAEYDFQGFAQSWSGAFLKSEKSAYSVVFYSEFNLVS